MMSPAVQLVLVFGIVCGHSFGSKPPNIGEKVASLQLINMYTLNSIETPYISVCLRAVYIITDDQDIKLGSLDVQPQVRKIAYGEGMFFENAFVTTPVCCPSR